MSLLTVKGQLRVHNIGLFLVDVVDRLVNGFHRHDIRVRNVVLIILFTAIIILSNFTVRSCNAISTSRLSARHITAELMLHYAI